MELANALAALNTDFKTFIDKANGNSADFSQRIMNIEQKLSKPTALFNGEDSKTVGDIVTESAQFKSMMESGFARSGRIKVGSLKSAIISSSDTSPAAQRVGYVASGRPALRLRDVLTTVPATGDTVEFVKLVAGSSTNAAAPQGANTSPQVYQNVAKAESAMTFALSSEPVQTIAHWIPASRQVISDNPALATFINTQLLFWLRQVEESQIVAGAGAGGDLNGLITQATSYDTGLDAAGDTPIDTLRRARCQLEIAGYGGNVCVVNPADALSIDLTKSNPTTGGEYIVGNPGSADGLWRMNVVSCAAVDEGEFVVFDSRAVFLYDRMEATVEISREHAEFFTKNMVAILAEERIALVIPDALAVVTGSFPSGE